MSHGWDDPDQVIVALSPVGKRVFCIETAGDTAFALLLAGASEVLAICPSFPQFALCELKKTALQMLPIQSVRSFLGLGYFGRRVWFYHYLREALSMDVRRYWDAREDMIREGILGRGIVEQRIEKVRKLAERGLGKPALDRAAHQDTPLLEGRARQLAGGLLLRRAAPGELGERLLSGLKKHSLRGNYLAEWALTGQYGVSYPAYLTNEGPSGIKRGGLLFAPGIPHKILKEQAFFDCGYTGYFPPDTLFSFASVLCWAELDRVHDIPTGWRETTTPGVGKAFFQKSLRVIEKVQ